MMILHKICFITLACLMVVNSSVSNKSEFKVGDIKPKKLNKNLREHIEEISKSTNAKPKSVKPELKQLFHSKSTEQEVKNNYQNIIDDLKPKTDKILKLNQSSYNLKLEELRDSNLLRNQETFASEDPKNNSKYSGNLKPANLDYYRYGDSRVNTRQLMPGVTNIHNNEASRFNGPHMDHNPNDNQPLHPNSGRVPSPGHRPHMWAPLPGHPDSPNQPSNTKPTIGTTTATTTKTTTEISVYIRNATLNDKTEGKILVPETNPNPDRVPPESHPTPQYLCQHCLCSANMSIVYCIGNYNKKQNDKVLQKNQMSDRVQTLLLKNYDNLEVGPQVFSSIHNIKEITFMDIKELHLNKESLYFVSKSKQNRKVVIKFVNCHFSQFPTDAITQNVDSRHEKRNFFSGETGRYLSIEFVNCTIGEMQTNSIHRALLYNFSMTQTKINVMSSRSIDLDVKTLAKFEANDMPYLPTEAICLHSNTVAFLFNKIRSMAKRSIVVEIKSKVLFNGNIIDELYAGALAGIEGSPSSFGPSIVFRNNIFKRIASKSFSLGGSFSATDQTLLNNTFYIMCSCYIEKEFESFTGSSLDRSPSLKLVLRSSHCIENVTGSFMLVDDFLSEECSPFPVVTVTAVTVAGILFIIAVTVCIVCALKVQQVKEEANMLGECTSQSFSTLSRNFTDTLGQPCNETHPSSPFALIPWGFAFPEVKTYQQNQVHEFTEQTESISDSRRNSLKGRRSENVGRVLERASCPFN